MENIINMYLSIVSGIVLGESSFKITLRFLVFYKCAIKICDSILVDQYQNPSEYLPDHFNPFCYSPNEFKSMKSLSTTLNKMNGKNKNDYAESCN